jgi:hypothetical protein
MLIHAACSLFGGANETAAHVVGQPSSSLSIDVVENIKRILEQRFSFLMLSGGGTNSLSHHPLKRVIVDRHSPCDVVNAALFPSDGDSEIETASFDSLRAETHSYSSERCLSMWFTQALHYYGLALSSSDLAPSLYSMIRDVRAIENLSTRRARMIRFTALQDGLISLQTLERVVATCL